VQTPEPEPLEPEGEHEHAPLPPPAPPPPAVRYAGGYWSIGARLTWLSGLLLAVSAFTDWYAGPSQGGITLGVIGWHTGALGKLVFFIGLAVLALYALHEAGVELPATLPESLIVIGLGAVATIFVLIRLISIPDEFTGSGRGVGIWISLVSAVAVIAAGLLTASEEL
jgi:hypothetical protein